MTLRLRGKTARLPPAADVRRSFVGALATRRGALVHSHRARFRSEPHSDRRRGGRLRKRSISRVRNAAISFAAAAVDFGGRGEMAGGQRFAIPFLPKPTCHRQPVWLSFPNLGDRQHRRIGKPPKTSPQRLRRTCRGRFDSYNSRSLAYLPIRGSKHREAYPLRDANLAGF